MTAQNHPALVSYPAAADFGDWHAEADHIEREWVADQLDKLARNTECGPTGRRPAQLTGPLYPLHTNDIGDWCPSSGEPLHDDYDGRCPQGCRAS